MGVRRLNDTTMKNQDMAGLISGLDHRAEETVWKRVSRLCRPMCGRAVPFRNDLIESGAAPHVRGVARNGWVSASGGAVPPPHIGRRSLERSFHTVSEATV